MKRLGLALAVTLVFAAVVSADTLHLKDGTTITGTIVGFDQSSFRVKTNYGYAVVRRDAVVSIDMGDATANAEKKPPAPAAPQPAAKPATTAPAPPTPSPPASTSQTAAVTSAPAASQPAPPSASPTTAASQPSSKPAPSAPTTPQPAPSTPPATAASQPPPKPALAAAPPTQTAIATPPEPANNPAPSSPTTSSAAPKASAPPAAPTNASAAPSTAKPAVAAAKPPAPPKPAEESISEASSGNSYANLTYGFHMFKPPAWEIIEGAHKTLPAAIAALGTRDESTYLLIGASPATGSLVVDLKSSDAKLRAMFDNYRPLGDTYTTLAGANSVWRQFRGSVDNREWSGVVVLFERGKQTYTILGMTIANSDLVQIQENVIRRAISSLEFTQ